jgi:hypothetical protein
MISHPRAIRKRTPLHTLSKRYKTKGMEEIDIQDIERVSIVPFKDMPSAITYDDVIAAFKALLKEAEEEVGLKTTQDPEKGGAEYWAAQKEGGVVHGVDRRIRLSRAVLASRKILKDLGA